MTVDIAGDANAVGAKLDYLIRVTDEISRIQAGIKVSCDGLLARVEAIERDVDRARHLLASVSRRTRVVASTIRVLFVVHLAENWDTLRPVVKAMVEAPDFEPIVVTVDASFLGEAAGREDELHDLLTREEIPHLRWKSMDDAASRHLLHYLGPDIVFRQTAWENSVPEALRSVETSAARICYIPYAFDLTESDHIVNLEMHHAAWRIFVPSPRHVEYFHRRSLLGGRNAVAVGHPGMDATAEQVEHGGDWPIAGSSHVYKVIWAPHHSIDAGWLGFATFPSVYSDMIDLAQSQPDVQIVFRAHKLLFAMLDNSNIVAAAEMERFLAIWESLPNTHIDRGSSYAATFAASDLLVTDGISFLAEYQVVGKPIVFIERDGHSLFNAFGRRVVQGTYVVKDGPSAVEKILAFRDGADDVLRGVRAEIVGEMSASPRRSADLILDEIRSGLMGEGALAAR